MVQTAAAVKVPMTTTASFPCHAHFELLSLFGEEGCCALYCVKKGNIGTAYRTVTLDSFSIVIGVETAGTDKIMNVPFSLHFFSMSFAQSPAFFASSRLAINTFTFMHSIIADKREIFIIYVRMMLYRLSVEVFFFAILSFFHSNS